MESVHKQMLVLFCRLTNRSLNHAFTKQDQDPGNDVLKCILTANRPFIKNIVSCNVRLVVRSFTDVSEERTASIVRGKEE
jgi:hypothetical protein